MEIIIGVVIAIVFGVIGFFFSKLFYQNNEISIKDMDRLKEGLSVMLLEKTDIEKLNIILKSENENKSTRITELKDNREAYQNKVNQQEIKLSELNANLQVSQNKLSFALKDLTNKEKVIELSDKKVEKVNLDNFELSKLTAKLKFENESFKNRLQVLSEEVETTRGQMKEAFENIAKKALKENTSELADANSKGVGNLVTPLREDLEKFKKDFREQIQVQDKDREVLRHEIKEIHTTGEQLKEEAEKLARTLKGDKKALGDWGENVLRTILDRSGLVDGTNYFFQNSMKDDGGREKRPDIIVKMPNNRSVVIDSKVSYVNYNNLQNAGNDKDAKIYLGALTRDVKNHIDDLAKKSYSDVVDNSLDFTMMFIPLEPALIQVMSHDPSLWEYAYNKRVLLIGPSNLISALKIVENLWVREKQNINTTEIMERATQLMSKFDVVLDKLAHLGNHLKGASEKYNETVSSFVDGQGSFKRQIELMENLGAKKLKGKTDHKIPVPIDVVFKISKIPNKND